MIPPRALLIAGQPEVTPSSKRARRGPDGRAPRPGVPSSKEAGAGFAQPLPVHHPRTNSAGRALPNRLLDELRRGAATLGIPLGAQELTAFSAYAEILTQWASRLNLTRLSEPEEIVYGHFLDSLTCLFADHFPEGARVIDVGSGAGFPGVPIKIARPDLSLTLLDASAKRVAFLDMLIDKLQISAETVHRRAEVAARDRTRREAYDRVLSRATAPLPQLLHLCLPLLRSGGRGVFPKGSRAMEEVGMAGEVLRAHQAVVVSVVRTPEMPSGIGVGEARQRCVIVIEKRSAGTNKTEYPPG